jgi:hypothetical protein
MTRTLKITGSNIPNIESGWGVYTIKSAEYGEWKDKQFIDVYFENFPETLNLRIYEAFGQDGNEFAIGNLFRYANAGIETVLMSDSGDKIMKINDTPSVLIGKKLGLFVYRDGKYYRILNRVVPAEPFKNEAEEITYDDISYFMKSAEKNYDEYVKPRLESSDKSSSSYERKSSW